MKYNKFFLLVLVISGFLIISGLVSLLLGQDANWDLKNYHIYNPWAFLNKRHGVDIAAAGVQTYFSPYIDIPYYYISIILLPESPKIVAFIFGLPFGFLSFCVFYIYKAALVEMKFDGWVKYSLLLTYGLIGLSGVSSVSQIATTFNEIYVALFVLVALVLAVEYINSPDVEVEKNLWGLLFCGFFVGLAAGLKLTAGVYAVGILFSFLLIDRSVSIRAKIFTLIGVGVIAGFSISYAPWGLFLYKQYENPFFPMFNGVFKSEWSDLASGIDDRFFPKSIRQYIYYPFLWADNNEMTVMEPMFRDWRFAIAFAALFCQILYFKIKKNYINPGSYLFWRKNSPVTYFVLSFFVASYVIWVALFSILRYAVPIEVMSGLVTLVGVVTVAVIYFPNRRELFVISISCLLLIFVLGTTKYPDWGRVQFGDRVFKVDSPEIPNGSLVIIVNKPLAFYAPFISSSKDNIAFIGYSDKIITAKEAKLKRQFIEKIREATGEIFALVRTEAIAQIEDLKEFNLKNLKSCKPVSSNIDNDVSICRLGRVD